MSDPQLEMTFGTPKSSAADSPAKMSPWQVIVRAWLETNPGFGLSFIDLLARRGLRGLSLRTSLDSCPRTEDGIWEPSSGVWETWGMGGRTECWTLSGSESPNVADVCSLSDVLETEGVPHKYFLTPRACAGILDRAQRRGKSLPAILKMALTNVASRGSASPLSESPEKPEVDLT